MLSESVTRSKCYGSCCNRSTKVQHSICRGIMVQCYSSVCQAQQRDEDVVVIPPEESEGYKPGQTDFAAATQHNTGIELTCQHPDSTNNNV